ncbi:MAG: PrsW family glutamic-type intramembrane protease [Bacteroidota bacterium]
MQIANLLLLAIPLAIAPGVGIVFFIYFRDKYEKEPFRMLRNCFLFGLLSIVPAILIELGMGRLGLNENQGWLMTMVYAFGVVGVAEEMSKFFFLRVYAFPKKDFNEPFDGIVYSIMISMGFATLENLMYVAFEGVGTAVLRMFTAVPLHAVCAIFMGYFVGKAKFARYPLWNMILGCGIAVFIHGLYDFFLFQQEMTQLAILSFIALGASVGFSFVAIRRLQKGSPFRTV